MVVMKKIQKITVSASVTYARVVVVAVRRNRLLTTISAKNRLRNKTETKVTEKKLMSVINAAALNIAVVIPKIVRA